MSSSRPIQSVTNTELYNRWAKVYDTDGNILQSVDDLMLPGLLTQVSTLLSAKPITVTELGCGTGRNTIKLLTPSQNPPITSLTALDLSPGMLAVAKQRCEEYLGANPKTQQETPHIEFHEFDALNPEISPEIKALEGKADLVLSTLVLEHLPIDAFFQTVKAFLGPGGYLLLTNMHADMGRISQAGFVDETGEKVRGLSYAHEISEVIEQGIRCGFEVVGEVGERAIEAADVGTVVGNRGKKWVGVNVWFGFVMRLTQREKQG